MGKNARGGLSTQAGERACSEESRGKIVGALQRAYPNALTFTELEKETGLSHDTIWRCLKILKSEGLVEQPRPRAGWRLVPKVLRLEEEIRSLSKLIK